MKLIPLYLLFLLPCIDALAQGPVLPGYMVRNQGDTLYGFLQVERKKELMHQIGFKRSDKEDLQVYGTDSLQSFQYDHGDLYRTISFINNSDGGAMRDTLFARSLVQGTFELYSISKDKESFYVARKDTSSYFMSDSRIEGENIVKGNYLGILNFLSAGCDSLNMRVTHTSFSDDYMAAFFRELNRCAQLGSGLREVARPSGLASGNISPGYIVNKRGDTLYGVLQDETDRELAVQISFKGSDKEALRIYGPDQLQSFENGHGDLYRSISFVNDADGGDRERETRFARAVVKGSYELYSVAMGNQLNYIIRKDTSTYFLSETKIIGENVIQGNYLNLLNFLSAGCDSLNRFVKRTSFDEGEMADFVRALNHCVAPDSSVVSYQHKTVVHKNFVIYIGALPSENRKQFTADAVLRLVYPNLGSRVSINMGLHYAYTYNPIYTAFTVGSTGPFVAVGSGSVNGKNSEISIPFTFQYNFTSWFIQPYAYGGLSLVYASQTGLDEDIINHYFGPGIVYGIGIEIHPGHVIILKADYRYEFFAQNVSVGVSLRF